eukprot:UC1_evm2s1037
MTAKHMMTTADDQALSELLMRCTAVKMAEYERLRRGAADILFWDLIVITATDEAQAACYRTQLSRKVASREIPRSRYHVVPDPPGPKIGNGGATLWAMAEMDRIYDAEHLETWRMLIIHAGGYSKRLPNVSIIGKIFAAVPCGDPVFQMLEVKLATYVDFPAKMSPGSVFVTCADDIELFDGTGDLSLDRKGFTALGHPSSLAIGTTHGVFALDKASRDTAARRHSKSSSSSSNNGSSKDDDASSRPPQPPCVTGGCTRFLHKPSIERMRAAGVVIPGTEKVYTDSAYCFCRDTARHLIAFWEEHQPLTCEIDAYGDFLQALGPEATDEYCGDVANVIAVEDSLTKTRRALFEHLKGTQLNVVLCDESKFYHIGTVPEYRFHYCRDPFFRSEMALSSRAAAQGSTRGECPESCIIQSVLAPGCTVGPGSVVEYCRLGVGSSVGADCVVSCLELPAGTRVPESLFMHTAALKGGFATVVLGGCKCEDFKAKAKAEVASDKLTFCDVPLGAAFERIGRTISSVWPASAKDSSAPCMLWTAKLYPLLPTMAESVAFALRIAACARGGEDAPLPPEWTGLECLQMADLLSRKDMDAALAWRDALKPPTRDPLRPNPCHEIVV